MFLRYITIFFLLFFVQNIFSQKNISVSGFVKDSLSHEALIGAYIVDPATNMGTTTNVYGYFNLKISENTSNFLVSYIGYGTKKLDLNSSDTIVNIYLLPENNIDEVVIKASGDHRIFATQTSLEKISAKTVSSLPVIMGESDITRTLQLLPGVLMGTEATNGYFVRGGNSDQNLLLIDGTPVYNAYHMFGLFSVFNSDAINDARFYKGGMPAQYGGRLSSVLDISMREGNANKFGGEFMLGTFSSRFLVEGPIFKNKTTFLLTGRRSTLDKSPELIKTISLALSGMDKERGDVQRLDLYSFYDINGKINHSFSEKSKLYFTFYNGKDSYDPKGATMELHNFKFGNTTSSIRWNYVFDNQLFANFSAYYAHFDYNNENGSGTKDKDGNIMSGSFIKSNTGITDYSLKADFDYALSNHQIKFGAQYVLQNIEPEVFSFNNIATAPQYNSNKTFQFRENAHQGSLYVSDDIRIGEKLTVNPELRLDAWFINNSSFFALQPRLTSNYRLAENLSLKASYSRQKQFLHFLSQNTTGAVSGMWVPSVKNIVPSGAHEFVAGINYKLFNFATITVEGFAKYMDNLIMYKEGASYAINKTEWYNMVEIGKGKSKGIEFGLRKETGKTTGWLSYTLSKSTRQFEEINFGKEFPFTFDRTHNIAIALVQKINKRFEVGADWLYATGNAVTLSETKYYNSSYIVRHYGSINNQRMPVFHRLDFCMNYNKEMKLADLKLSVGAYNVYGRQNPYYITETVEGISKISLFKVLPYVSLAIKF